MINNYNSEVLSEIYIIIFLNKLKIVENTPKKPSILREVSACPRAPIALALFLLAKFLLEALPIPYIIVIQ
jgi:hypothetical protein